MFDLNVFVYSSGQFRTDDSPDSLPVPVCAAPSTADHSIEDSSFLDTPEDLMLFSRCTGHLHAETSPLRNVYFSITSVQTLDVHLCADGWIPLENDHWLLHLGCHLGS